MSAALLCATSEAEQPESTKQPPPVIDSNPNAQRPPKPAPKPEPIAPVEQVAEKQPPTETYEVTAYTAQCDGCIGITKTGVDVRHTIKYEGKRIVAVDPSVIALGSTVELRLANGRTIEATAQDVGGAIKGRRLDLLVADRATAIEFGRQNVEVRIIEEGTK